MPENSRFSTLIPEVSVLATLGYCPDNFALHFDVQKTEIHTPIPPWSTRLNPCLRWNANWNSSRPKIRQGLDVQLIQVLWIENKSSLGQPPINCQKHGNHNSAATSFFFFFFFGYIRVNPLACQRDRYHRQIPSTRGKRDKTLECAERHFIYSGVANYRTGYSTES